MISKTFDRPRRSAIYQGRIHRPRIRLAFIPKGQPAFVSILIWFVVPVIILLMLLARAGALVAGTAASYPNPFAAHQALMPGQLAEAVEGAICSSGSPREPNKVCSVYPQDGLFHLISFTESQSRIAEVSFFSESLQLGSLLEQWGEPDTMRRNAGGRTFTLVWDSPLFSASTILIPNGHEGYVRLVTITATADIH